MLNRAVEVAAISSERLVSTELAKVEQPVTDFHPRRLATLHRSIRLGVDVLVAAVVVVVVVV